MGLLRRDGDEQTLPARCVLGRSANASIRLDDPRVSSEHARITWTGRTWEIRDLGSTNGTWVDGKRLEAGGQARLYQGVTLGFADPTCPWQLADATGPLACARNLVEGTLHSAEDGLLGLPPGNEPRLVVYEDTDGRWVGEHDGEPGFVEDGSIVVVAGSSWCLHLPTANDLTVDFSNAPLRLDQLQLSFAVSSDEEDVRMSVVHARGREALKSRVHHYLLLVLARHRIEDAKDGVETGEQGWVYGDDLSRMLRIEEERLNVQIFRARKELGELGVAGAAGLIERRKGSRKLRIGVRELSVESM